MSSDPKGPETTPLSAERALNLLRMAARVDPLLRQAVADVDATIEALQAEVTTLRTGGSRRESSLGR